MISTLPPVRGELSGSVVHLRVLPHQKNLLRSQVRYVLWAYIELKEGQPALEATAGRYLENLHPLLRGGLEMMTGRQLRSGMPLSELRIPDIMRTMLPG